MNNDQKNEIYQIVFNSLREAAKDCKPTELARGGFQGINDLSEHTVVEFFITQWQEMALLVPEDEMSELVRVAQKWLDEQPKPKTTVEIINNLLKVIEMLSPGLRHIAIQDYQLYNEAQIEARQHLGVLKS